MRIQQFFKNSDVCMSTLSLPQLILYARGRWLQPIVCLRLHIGDLVQYRDQLLATAAPGAFFKVFHGGIAATFSATASMTNRLTEIPSSHTCPVVSHRCPQDRFTDARGIPAAVAGGARKKAACFPSPGDRQTCKVRFHKR